MLAELRARTELVPAQKRKRSLEAGGKSEEDEESPRVKKSSFDDEDTEVGEWTEEEKKIEYEEIEVKEEVEAKEETKRDEEAAAAEDETKSQDGHPDKAPEHRTPIDVAFQELTIEEQGASDEADSQNPDAETAQGEGQPQPDILEINDFPPEWGHFHKKSPGHE